MPELSITLRSETTFGRGDGVVGLINNEVEHDAKTGLPFIRGRTIKGLLVEECVNILYALEIGKSPSLSKMEDAATWLFGIGGSTLREQGQLQVGSAYLPQDLCHVIQTEVADNNNPLTASDVLNSLTNIRYQTAIDAKTGVAADGSLRATRVLIKGLVFTAHLGFISRPSYEAEALLCACVHSLRSAGIGRNRGTGQIVCKIEGLTATLDDFENYLKG